MKYFVISKYKIEKLSRWKITNTTNLPVLEKWKGNDWTMIRIGNQEVLLSQNTRMVPTWKSKREKNHPTADWKERVHKRVQKFVPCDWNKKVFGKETLFWLYSRLHLNQWRCFLMFQVREKKLCWILTWLPNWQEDAMRWDISIKSNNNHQSEGRVSPL